MIRVEERAEIQYYGMENEENTLVISKTAEGEEKELAGARLALYRADEEGNFPMVDKLVEVAETYGFDGWFINQESEGDDTAGLTKEHADLMLEFIKAFKAAAPELELVYYDSMTVDGEMDWQNALTNKNAAFLTDGEGNAVADDMFLNFWWTQEEYAAAEAQYLEEREAALKAAEE